MVFSKQLNHEQKLTVSRDQIRIPITFLKLKM